MARRAGLKVSTLGVMGFIAVFILLCAAGFLAGSESALNSVSRVWVEELEERKPKLAKRLGKILADPYQYVNVMLLVRKAFELSATILVADAMLASHTHRLRQLLLTVVIMVVASFIIVGVVPRTLGKQNALAWVGPAAIAAETLTTALAPIAKLLIAVGNALTPGKGFKTGPFSSEAELRDLVDQASERGLVEEAEREMIHSVFDLGETLVRELMVPRTDMVYMEAEKTVRQGLSLALRSGFTRIPVIDENLDNIVGIAYVKDLAKRVHDFRESENLEEVGSIVRPASFIPENKKADELLRQMQRDQIHMAVVVDEYGGTAGLITIEDILEEIVGEIADEYDQEDAAAEWLDKESARFSARINVDEFQEFLDLQLTPEELEDVDSLGGLLAKHLGRVPIPGSTVDLAGWQLIAERPVGRRHRIATILAKRQNQPTLDSQ
jgi:CBS domain containing-hemolysin-like protein